MAIITTESYFLRKIPFRETSWIVTCLTRSHGKVKGIVKGARKWKSPWLSACELLTYAQIVFYEKTKSNLHLITDISVLKSNERIRSRLSTLVHGSYFAELMDALLEENDPQEPLFDLLHATVALIEKANVVPQVLARAFEIKALELAGFLPRSAGCMQCRAREAAKFFFSPSQGGILCERCHAQVRGGFVITGASLRVMNQFSTSKLDSVQTLELTPQVNQELEQIARQFIERRIDKRLRSWHFISQIKPLLLKPALN